MRLPNGYGTAVEDHVAQSTWATYLMASGQHEELRRTVWSESDDAAPLFTPDRACEFASVADDATASDDDRRRARRLLGFTIEGLLAGQGQILRAEMIRRQAGWRFAHERLGDLDLASAAAAQAAEESSVIRERIEAAYLEFVAEKLNPLLIELRDVEESYVAALGWASLDAVYACAYNIDVDSLATVARQVLVHSGPVLAQELELLEETVACPDGAVTRSALAHFLRAPYLDAGLPPAVPCALDTFRALGLPCEEPGVTVDTRQRSGQSIGACCYAIRVPHKVVVFCSPTGGRLRLVNVLHELGHAAQLASCASELHYADRVFIDEGWLEGCAFAFASLAGNAQWLSTYTESSVRASMVQLARAELTFSLRYHAAKFLHRVERNYSNAPSESARFATWARRAMGFAWPDALYLVDPSRRLYDAQYLRGWLLSARLLGTLEHGFGDEWFTSAEAGAELRRLWRSGGGTLHADAGSAGDLARLLRLIAS